MTQHKANIRYTILDHCLRERMHNYTILDLLDTVNHKLSETDNPAPISERQLYDDLAYMRSPDGYNADIETYRIVRPDSKGRNRSYTAYRYADPDFSISNPTITENQILNLRAALQILRQCIGIDNLTWEYDSINALNPVGHELKVKKCLQFGYNPFLGGHRAIEVGEYFKHLLGAINFRYPLTIKYKHFDKEEITLHFHPCFMRQNRNMWYVLGVTTDKPDNIVILALDRIQCIDSCTDTYIDYPFDPETYFEDFIGVVDPGGEPVDVHLQFVGWVAPYLEINPIHGSQRSRWVLVNGERRLDVHLFVKINQELEGALLGFMDCLIVISPDILVERFKARVQRVIELNNLKVVPAEKTYLTKPVPKAPPSEPPSK